MTKVRVLTAEQKLAAKERARVWRLKRKAEGLPTQYHKPRSDGDRTRAAELARARYKPKKRQSVARAPLDQWKHRAVIAARHRAKKKGFDFDLSVGDFEVPELCPILGMPLQINNGQATRKNGNSPSLDRIDNKKGYVKGNVWVISARANHLKSDASFTEIIALLAHLKAAEIAAPSSSTTIVHINRHHLAANAKDGGNRPIVSVKEKGTTRYAREVRFLGPTRLRYDGTMLKCGARTWIETHHEVELIDEMSFKEARGG